MVSALPYLSAAAGLGCGGGELGVRGTAGLALGVPVSAGGLCPSLPGRGGGGAGAALVCGAWAAASLGRPRAPAGLDFRAPEAGRELRRPPCLLRWRWGWTGRA